jgi:hypothetical protein
MGKTEVIGKEKILQKIRFLFSEENFEDLCKQLDYEFLKSISCLLHSLSVRIVEEGKNINVIDAIDMIKKFIASRPSSDLNALMQDFRFAPENYVLPYLCKIYITKYLDGQANREEKIAEVSSILKYVDTSFPWAINQKDKLIEYLAKECSAEQLEIIVLSLKDYDDEGIKKVLEECYKLAGFDKTDAKQPPIEF